jgi:hypothetical protein
MYRKDSDLANEEAIIPVFIILLPKTYYNHA